MADARNGTLSDTDEPSLESRVADNVMVFCELVEEGHLVRLEWQMFGLPI